MPRPRIQPSGSAATPVLRVCLALLVLVAQACGGAQKIDTDPRGTLRIQGEPEEALLDLDETHLGPVKMFETKGLLLRPGPHRVIVSADDYFPEYKIVEIEQDKIVILKVELRPIPK